MNETPSETETVSIPAQGTTTGVNDYRPRHRDESAPAVGPTGPTGPTRPWASRPVASVTPRPVAPPVARSMQPHLAPRVERVYTTPGWIAESAADQTVPHQSTALHDVSPATGTPVGTIPETGRIPQPVDLVRQAKWTTPRSGVLALVVLLVSAVAVAVTTGSGLLEGQTTPTLVIALALALAASGINAILVAVRPSVVEIDEAWLTVRHRGQRDRFDLTSPHQEIAVSGRPGTASWALALGSPSGRIVTVTGTMVDSQALHAVVAHAQLYAERDRAARRERFNR